MFNFNILNILGKLSLSNSLNKEAINEGYIDTPSPQDIRTQVQNADRCTKCNFLLFDNYWTPDVSNDNLKICPTCGNKFVSSIMNSLELSH